MGRLRAPRPTRRLPMLVVGIVLGMVLLAAAPGARAAVPLSISVVGNHFVNGMGQTIRLLGVNREGTEYACYQGTGYSVGPEDASDAAAIAAWHANAVRIPINEDCWLGINGEPAYGTADGYRQMIEGYVAALNADGIYAILDLQWNAPGSLPANGLRTMPDDNSPAFWRSVATTFLDNPAVVFDAFNEPHSVSWACWRNGGCQVPDAVDGTPPDLTQTYTAVGMQAIVNDIRATGAHQPILVAGLNHGNDLSGLLTYMPSDPDGQLGASFHVYQPNACNNTTCWDSTVAPVAAVMPTSTIEFSEQDCSENWDNTLMDWDDAHGVGYLGWGWFILTRHCQSLYLITSWSGTPASPNGTALHDHLAALWAATPPPAPCCDLPVACCLPPTDPGAGSSPPASGSGSPATTGGATATPRSRSCAPGAGAGACLTPKLRLLSIRLTRRSLSLRLRSSLAARGRVSARTVAAFQVAASGHAPRLRIALGARRFRLAAEASRVITVALPARARRLLTTHSRVRARVTITVTGAAGPAVTVARVVAGPRHRR